MLKLMTLTQLRILFNQFSGGTGKRRMSAAKRLGMAVLLVYLLGVFGLLFWLFFSSIAAPFCAVGAPWLFFVFYAIAATAIMFFGSVFAAKAQLYEAKDNELLLSMPIRPSAILASRMVTLVILNGFFALTAAVPAVVAWCGVAPLSVTGWVMFLLLTLALVLFSTALSCLIGWLIALATARVRNKSLMTVVFSIAFLGVYFYFYSQINVYVMHLVEQSAQVASKLSGSPLFWLGNCVAAGNWGQLAVVLLALLTPFVLACVILSATFLPMVTAKRGFHRIQYRERELRVGSAVSALRRREVSHLLHSPPYLMNAGIGVVMLVIAAAALVIMRQDVQALVQMFGFSLPVWSVILALAACLLSGMTLFTAPSISIEGKTLPILRALPVPSKQILRAKLWLHNVMTMPAMALLAVVGGAVLGLPADGWVLAVLTPLAFTAVSANLGLICGLRHPKLDWVSEMQAVKQSVAVLIAMGLDWLLVLLPALAYFLWLQELVSGTAFLAGYLAVLALLWWASDRWLNGCGVRAFERL